MGRVTVGAPTRPSAVGAVPHRPRHGNRDVPRPVRRWGERRRRPHPAGRRARRPRRPVTCPYEDDRASAVILSEAVLPVNDTRITDPAILSRPEEPAPLSRPSGAARRTLRTSRASRGPVSRPSS
ncbi:DUF7737 domain-containing protein [Streptomyces viridosporus]|uniref:DUF7737 domain-containing protein n=1 Tax=Streptomyces viridosporus TaxID=67581 RepID=UPI003F657F69